MQELLELIKGKVMDIALKHDASRVVQTALQFGNREVRMNVQRFRQADARSLYVGWNAAALRRPALTFEVSHLQGAVWGARVSKVYGVGSS